MLASLALYSTIGLLVTWFAYPLGMLLLGRMFRKKRPLTAAGRPSVVSVVLATRESTEAVAARIVNCLETRHPEEKLEVVVALDREITRAERQELRAVDGRVRLVERRGSRSGKAMALNAGVAAARGEIVVFADTHQRFDDTTIPNLVKGLADPSVGAVSGALHLPRDRALLVRCYWTVERWLRRAEARLHSTVGVTGSVYALRRELWTPLPSELLLDDVYAPMQLVLKGYRIGFRPDARAVETRRSCPKTEYRRKVRTLTGVFQLCAWLPAVLSPLHNRIWLQFVCHKLLRLFTPYWLLTLLAWAAYAALLSVELPSLVIGAAIVLTIWVSMGRGHLAGRLRTLATEGALLQLAIVTAGMNALRGRWKVWG